jgi:hypothetical protein
LATGDEIVKHFEAAHHEVGGFIESVRASAGMELVPIFAASRHA